MRIAFTSLRRRGHGNIPGAIIVSAVGSVKGMNADLNKFLVLARERKKCAPGPVAGYFVSLGGFTETAIEQEIEYGDGRPILLTAQDVVLELQRRKVIVSCTEAAERAGHCAQRAGLGHAALDGAELLGHERGYLWAVFYSHKKERTHFALIHADGTPLAEAIAREIIDADRLCGGAFHSLGYLAPPVSPPDRLALAAKAAASVPPMARGGMRVYPA
jgi:hypothetical protein